MTTQPSGKERGEDYWHGPIWEAFGLTYAAYAVFPRRALQSMPREWQEKLIALIDEAHQALSPEAFAGDYTVTMRKNGRIAKDPLRDYRHTGPLPLRAENQESDSEQTQWEGTDGDE